MQEVRLRTYTELAITGKSLTVVADGPGVRFFSVRVRELKAGQAVRVRGLDVASLTGFAIVPFVAEACDGPVYVEECAFRGRVSFNLVAVNSDGARVVDCESVTFVRCVLDVETDPKPDSATTPYEGACGLVARSSRVTLYECQLAGGAAPATPGARGGHGAMIVGGTMLAAGSTFRGADGADANGAAPCVTGGDGGDGVRLTDTYQVAPGFSYFAAPASAVMLDVVFTPGPGGGPDGPCPGGAAGIGLNVISGAASVLAEPSRSMSALTALRAGQTQKLRFAAPPGDVAVLLLSPSLDGTMALPMRGTLLTSAPFLAFVLGPVPPSGEIDLSIAAPALPAGVDGVALIHQGAFGTPSGQVRLGSGSDVLLLGAGF